MIRNIFFVGKYLGCFNSFNQIISPKRFKLKNFGISTNFFGVFSDETLTRKFNCLHVTEY